MYQKAPALKEMTRTHAGINGALFYTILMPNPAPSINFYALLYIRYTNVHNQLLRITTKRSKLTYIISRRKKARKHRGIRRWLAAPSLPWLLQGESFR